MPYLFVYGIFKPSSRQQFSSFLDGCECLGSATVPGFVLLRTGACAAMVPGRTMAWSAPTDPTVKGELIEVPEAEWPRIRGGLDTIESNGQNYIRVKVDAVLDRDSETYEAYAYLWIQSYAGDEVIPDGNWKF